MDILDDTEEEARIRQEELSRDFEESIFGKYQDKRFYQDRDFLGKGKEVNPSGKQMKILNTIAGQLKISASSLESIGTVKRSKSRRFSTSFNSGSDQVDNELLSDLGLKDFDLTSKPSILINSGYVTKLEVDGSPKKTSRKYLFLFSNVLLITLKKDQNIDSYDLQAVIWVQDMRLQYYPMDNVGVSQTSSSASSTDENFIESKLYAFEIISVKTRSRPQLNYTFVCDSGTNYTNWIEDLENVLLAYHLETSLSKQIGWYHEIILGNIFSAAYTGDSNLLRRHLRVYEKAGGSIDDLDKSGMSALHWAVLQDQEVCVRLLLDHGADPNQRQCGENTCLLLAAARGNDSICRLLIERGADIAARNAQDRGAIFMCVIYGHASRGLPWLLQLLTSRGLDISQIDRKGYSPLHLCAEKNITRPIRMLVDAGAEVNAPHGVSQLSALQMACSSTNPDIETIRSFLEKGAYPNWKDLEGRTALDIVLRNRSHPLLPQSPAKQPSVIPLSAIPSTSPSGHQPVDLEAILSSSPNSSSIQPYTKWRQMDSTLEQVGRWAVKILPVLLELIKHGARFQPSDFESFRPSFRAAILEARRVWETKASPSGFHDYVSYRQQLGERLVLNKKDWMKDNTSTSCQLCSDVFGLKNRRHHCRACGSLVCDLCSSKRLDLGSFAMNEGSSNPSKGNDRVCDGCFNRLSHEANQPSPEHIRVRSLRQCAMDLIQSVGNLIDILDESDGSLDPITRQTELLSRAVDDFKLSSSSRKLKIASPSETSSSYSSQRLLSPVKESPTIANTSSDEYFIEVVKQREEKLSICEDIAKKFIDVADGYHRSSKRLIEQKMANKRLWGMNA